jgi:hypothetical protein
VGAAAAGRRAGDGGRLRMSSGRAWGCLSLRPCRMLLCSTASCFISLAVLYNCLCSAPRLQCFQRGPAPFEGKSQLHLTQHTFFALGPFRNERLRAAPRPRAFSSVHVCVRVVAIAGNRRSHRRMPSNHCLTLRTLTIPWAGMLTGCQTLLSCASSNDPRACANIVTFSDGRQLMDIVVRGAWMVDRGPQAGRRVTANPRLQRITSTQRQR